MEYEILDLSAAGPQSENQDDDPRVAPRSSAPTDGIYRVPPMGNATDAERTE